MDAAGGGGALARFGRPRPGAARRGVAADPRSQAQVADVPRGRARSLRTQARACLPRRRGGRAARDDLSAPSSPEPALQDRYGEPGSSAAESLEDGRPANLRLRSGDGPRVQGAVDGDPEVLAG